MSQIWHFLNRYNESCINPWNQYRIIVTNLTHCSPTHPTCSVSNYATFEWPLNVIVAITSHISSQMASPFLDNINVWINNDLLIFLRSCQVETKRLGLKLMEMRAILRSWCVEISDLRPITGCDLETAIDRSFYRPTEWNTNRKSYYCPSNDVISNDLEISSFELF